MSAENTDNQYKNVGSTPSPDTLGDMAKASPSPRPSAKPRPTGSTAKVDAKDFRLDPDQGLNDDLEDEDQEENKANEDAKPNLQGRPASSVETLASLLINGGKVALSGGKKASTHVAARTKDKQVTFRIKKLDQLSEKTASFRNMMGEHKSKFGSLADNAHVRYNAPDMKAKYPSEAVRKQAAMVLAAKEFSGPSGNYEANLDEFNRSYAELKSSMGECLTLTESIAAKPKQYENLGPDMVPKIDDVMSDSLDALLEAKTVKNVSPGSDETLDKSFKDRMDDIQKQVEEFLDRIKALISKVLGR